MKTVTISASKEYPVIIGSGILGTLGKEAAKVCRSEIIAVVSDSNVWPIWGRAVLDSLNSAGFSPVSYVFPAGEASKCGKTYLDLLNFLAENQLTRADCLIALGGGVVGDLTGFAAATYLRGIPYIQVPTTLLAAVDSSVGGKTAIDLPAGKNLAGAFFQPSLVLCDVDVLSSLPRDIFRDGSAEVIKYGVLYDPDLFAHLDRYGLSFDREAVIAKCVAWKRDVVVQDEFDTGARQKLNLGHTIGHAIETCSHFSVTHGQAVAVGMAIVARAGTAFGICRPGEAERIVAVLDRFGLPTGTEFSAEDLYHGALSDKKRLGSTINLIIPQSIGTCVIHPFGVDTLLPFIKAGL